MSSADFSFPLNVYARMLQREEGRLDYLHYGLFDRPDEPVWQAQERASARLWKVLPPPCRVLEVGIGVGTTLRRLGEAGYRATGITPDVAQVAEVRRRYGDDMDAQVCTLEAMCADSGRFDLLLLQESAQYIDPLALFEAADRLLSDDACIVMMDEFALRRSAPASQGLHLHAHVLALAVRLGWTVEHDEDVSAQAALTVDAIARLVVRQRQSLLGELRVKAEQLDDLLRAADRYRRCYASGEYGYRLLRLRRRERPPVRLSALTQGDAAAMRALFKRVFGKPMTADEWHWKYRGGRGHAVGLWRGDDLVAHYGATTRTVRWDGREVAAAQVGDVMVRPDANAGLGRQGALKQVSATLLEQQIGWGAPHRVGFGFPNERAMRVAERLGLYAAVDEVIELQWSTMGSAPSLPSNRLWRIDEIDPASLVEGQPAWRMLQRAWAAMTMTLPRALLPERNATWWRHRYGSRPDVAYRIFVRRHVAGLRTPGALAMREHEDHVELIDLVGPAADLVVLVRVARQLAAQAGRQRLTAWITRSHVQWLDDPQDPAQRIDIGVKVPTSVHTPGPSPDELRGRWFLMSGDTDFR